MKTTESSKAIAKPVTGTHSSIPKYPQPIQINYNIRLMECLSKPKVDQYLVCYIDWSEGICGETFLRQFHEWQCRIRGKNYNVKHKQE